MAMRKSIGAASEKDVQKLESMIKDADKRMAYEHDGIKKVIICQDREIRDLRIKTNALIGIAALLTLLITMMFWGG